MGAAEAYQPVKIFSARYCRISVLPYSIVLLKRHYFLFLLLFRTDQHFPGLEHFDFESLAYLKYQTSRLCFLQSNYRFPGQNFNYSCRSADLTSPPYVHLSLLFCQPLLRQIDL